MFANNHAGHGGGACLFQQTHVLLTGKEIKFIANTAYHGGGIWSNESTLLMLAKKLQFISNAAKRQDYFRGGGAVMISGPAKKKVKLTGKYIGNTGCLEEQYSSKEVGIPSYTILSLRATQKMLSV